jgi:membrane fusion protein (multidrug efflux system)
VQRVPVRVEIDPSDLAAHPLRMGLSMHATVDVGGAAGAPVAASAASAASAAAPRASSRTTVFQPASDDADRRVQAIIASQLGRAPRSRTPLAP